MWSVRLFYKCLFRLSAEESGKWNLVLSCVNKVLLLDGLFFMTDSIFCCGHDYTGIHLSTENTFVSFAWANSVVDWICALLFTCQTKRWYMLRITKFIETLLQESVSRGKGTSVPAWDYLVIVNVQRSLSFQDKFRFEEVWICTLSGRLCCSIVYFVRQLLKAEICTEWKWVDVHEWRLVNALLREAITCQA